MKGEARLSGRVTFLIVGSLFLVIAILMGALGVYLYRTSAKAIPMAACMVFAWAFGSTVISMMLVLLTSGRRTRGKVGVRKGKVSIRFGSRSPGSNNHITGRGIEAEGEAGTPINSPIPFLFLFASSTGLAVLGLFLFGHHRPDLIGSGMFIAFIVFIANWGRLAWPCKVLHAAANKGAKG